MAQEPLYLDPPDRDWRRRKITIVPHRWFAEIRLDREGYISRQINPVSAELSPQFVEALSALRAVCSDRIWLVGYPGGFYESNGPSCVVLCVPYRYADRAVAALQSAELDADVSGLEALCGELALPIAEWLSPGEHYLRRGVDFDPTPRSFLGFLRAKAKERGLRLNGRADEGGVWVRPQRNVEDPLAHGQRMEQPGGQESARGDASVVSGQSRPRQERRSRSRFGSIRPVEFTSTGAKPDTFCSCGGRFVIGNADQHEAQHLQWSLGVKIPHSITWGSGDMALVRTQSATRWRQLAATVAQVPQRENHYDFPSWSDADSPEAITQDRRAYLLRSCEWVIGYLVAADVTSRHRWDFSGGAPGLAADASRRPSIELIWVAATHRRQGLGRLLVEHLAADSAVPLEELAWSWPLSKNGGKALARSITPDGVWIYH